MEKESDPGTKTEEPTDKKIHDEIARGNIPISREASFFAFTAAALVITAFMARDLFRSISVALNQLANDPAGWSLQNGTDIIVLCRTIAFEAAAPLIPLVAVFTAAGLASALFQHAPRMIFDRIRPDLARISLVNGWRRIFSARGLADFTKSVLKLASIAFALFVVLRQQTASLTGVMSLDPESIPELVLAISTRLLSAACLVTILVFMVDLLWVRVHWRKELRMTRQELKDELKEVEGDPLRKARLRSLALDRRRKAMIAAVPRATLVIANPTHYAIALRYVREEGGAPVVLSKGKDFIALRIREIAAEHAIPVIEDKALARSMYDAVEIDRPIPPEFYKAVAELIHFLYVKNTQRHARR